LSQWPLLHEPPLQSEFEPQCPHVPLEQVPTLQSEFDPQCPHVPLEQVPLPLQSEFEPHDPHLPFEHVPVAQSEFEPQNGSARLPNTVEVSIDATSFAFSASYAGTGTAVVWALRSLAPQAAQNRATRTKFFMAPS